MPSSSFSFVVCQNYLNRTRPSGFTRLVSAFGLPVTCSKNSQINFSHGTNRQTFPMTSSAMLKFNPSTFKLKLQISSPRFPLLLFTLSHTPTHKLHYRSTHLSGYSANFQCCKCCRTPCQPSGSTRCPTNMAQGSQRKPSSANNTKSILLVNSITTKESATSNAGK